MLLQTKTLTGRSLEKLRNDRHSVWYIAEMSPSVTDNEVLQLADSQAALLLTSDKDFGELVFRQKLTSHGVVLIRLPGMDPQVKAEIVSSVMTARENELLRNFTVISSDRVRIRKI